jgi:hypothetical protein
MSLKSSCPANCCSRNWSTKLHRPQYALAGQPKSEKSPPNSSTNSRKTGDVMVVIWSISYATHHNRGRTVRRVNRRRAAHPLNLRDINSTCPVGGNLANYSHHSQREGSEPKRTNHTRRNDDGHLFKGMCTLAQHVPSKYPERVIEFDRSKVEPLV